MLLLSSRIVGVAETFALELMVSTKTELTVSTKTETIEIYYIIK
jgi:hypothetical protein